MSPRIVQDIVPTDRPRRIKPIPAEISDVNNEENVAVQPEKVDEFKNLLRRSEPKIREVEEDEYEPVGKFKEVKHNSSSKKIFTLIFLVLAILGGAILLVNKYFSYVQIYITPKTMDYTFEKESFTASKEINAPLHFEIMIVDGEDKNEAVFTEMKEISTKAKGKVVFYNKFSSKPQKLSINTRITDDKKQIYYTDKEITIPGFTGSGTKIVPGSVEVDVTASMPGPLYNGSPRDFTIVGYAGTTKSTKIYARSSTPLTGGEVGNFYVLSAEGKGKATVEGSTALYNKLLKKFQAQVPPGYIVYTGGMQYNKTLTDSAFQSKTKEGFVSLQGTLSAPIFKESELREAIIRNVYPEVKDLELSEVNSPNMKNLVFEYVDDTTVISKTINSFKFSLSGTDTLLWSPLIETLKGRLSGVSKENLDEIYTTDPGVSRARAIFRPPWQASVPTDVNHISITLE